MLNSEPIPQAFSLRTELHLQLQHADRRREYRVWEL